MKVYQDLRVGPLTEEQERDFLSVVEGSLIGGWSRDRNRERELNLSFYCFVCTKEKEREAATLVLTRQEKPSEGFLWVPNIVPKDLGELTHDQYNLILTEFYDRFARPAADLLRIPIELSSSEQTIENWFSPQVVRLLKIFAGAANKSTGAGHPNDRRRWFDFIIAAHHAEENPDVGLLERWLREEGHFPEHVASNLIAQFEFGLALLRQFDS